MAGSSPLPEVHWLLLDLNSYFASCEQQDHPRLRGKPVAVVPLLVDTTSCIAASYEAKAFGVKTGTKVADAKKMCPGIHFILARHKTYVQYHQKIVEAVESCVPVTKVLSIDEMACELTGSHRQISRAVEIAGQIKAALKKKVGICLKCSIGIATNRYLAKVASDMKKPDGLVVLRKESLPHSLFGLGLRDLPGVGPRMETRLKEQGVSSIEALCGFSQLQMRKLWGGIWGDRMYRWLRGEEVELPARGTQSVSHEHVLPPELRTTEGAGIVLRRLLSKAAVRIRREGFFTRYLGIRVKLWRPAESWESKQRMAETQDTLFLLRALDRALRYFPKGVPLRVGVVLADLIPADRHQLSFFDDFNRENLIEALDTINEKFGRDTVYFGALHRERSSAKIAFQRVPDLREF